MMSLPFLLPVHRLPVPSFEAEALALLLGLVAALGVLRLRPHLPASALGPVALALVLALQLALGMAAYASDLLLPLALLAWSALLMVAGRSIVAVLGVAATCTVLAWWVLAGGVASAICGVLQWSGLATAAGALVWPGAPGAVAGNLAQQNHFATQLALALASAAWLASVGRLRRLAACALALLLLGAMMLSGSRSGLLYLAAIGGAWFAAGASRQRGAAGDAGPARRWRHVLGAGAAVALLWAAAAAGLFGPQLVRLGQIGEGLGPRLFLWRQAWTMFAAHPWLGVGFDGFAWTLLGQLGPQDTRWGLDQYAHNLGLQLLAGCGLAGFAAVALPALAWLRRVLAYAGACTHWWAWSVLAILFIHSMLEQPLYYCYFLGIAAVVAGMLDPHGRALALQRWQRRASMAMVCVAMAALAVTTRDYDTLARQFYADARPLDGARLATLDRLHARTVFAPLAELIAPERIVGADAPAADRLALNSRLLHFAPIADVAFRQAALLAEAGLPAQAQVQLRQAARAYPADLPAYLARFDALASRDGSTFARLAAFAHQQEAQ